MFVRSAAAVLTLVACLGVAGCGSSENLAPVRGKVTYKGKPVTSGGVVFQPARGQPASGVIGPDGTFTLTTNTPGDGAAVGKHQVRISSYEVIPGTPASGGESRLGKSLLPEHYANFGSSGLTFEVKPGANDNAVFDLVDGPAGGGGRPIGP